MSHHRSRGPLRFADVTCLVVHEANEILPGDDSDYLVIGIDLRVTSDVEESSESERNDFNLRQRDASSADISFSGKPPRTSHALVSCVPCP